MTTTADFDELAGKTFAPNAGESDYETLFAAVFSLPEWHFAADGEMPNLSPYCALFPDFFGDEPAVAVFTDAGRARKFISESDEKFGSADKSTVIDSGGDQVNFASEESILSVPTTNILDYIEKLIPKGIVKIFFNPDKDSRGFSNDLKIMRPIYEHLKSKGLISKTDANPAETETTSIPVEEKIDRPENNVDFDLLSRKANEPNAPRENLNALFGAAFALEKWNFIARGEMPNVNPYIASRADVADGQQMVRAFTDAARLQRFAKENNLTREDGSVDILSIPTAAIVEYLEQFMEYGVHGVWFNSDVQSDGFFVPLKQLRPIKEHLEKIKSAAAEKVYTALLLTISDGLAMPSGFVSKSTYNCNFFCWIPREWTEDSQLKPEYLEKLYMQFYGANWRAGNSDGSRYVVFEANSAVMSPERAENTKWNVVENTEFNRYRFYIGEGDGTFRNVSADEFQTNFDAFFEKQKRGESLEKRDRSADFGMSQTPDGSFDINLSVNRVGAVNFDTSIAPFYEAIAPLLKDFQGTGDYLALLRFEPSGKSQEVENIAENAHGAYLQIRRFVYLNPKNGVRIGVNSIHGNHLRHVQSNAELLVSIELCKNLDNQTAAFYHAFQGPRSDVLNLIAAIEPLLESAGYDPVR